jgi:GNAT superfamily N-acetyltransferase
VRLSVNENCISDLSVLKAGDTERILAGDGCAWVSEVGGRIVGFAMADLSGANVYALFVEPGCEGRGIGRRLHDTMMDWFFAAGVPEVWLSTDPNTRAESFYRRAGWLAAGTQPNGEIRFTMSHRSWAASRRQRARCDESDQQEAHSGLDAD